MAGQINIIALEGVPLVHPGDDLVEIIINALTLSNECLKNDDVLVVAQKIISKAEGRIVALDSVSPSERAEKLAIELGKDPRQIELVLQESREIVRSKPGVVIVEQNLGLVMANAGIDRSNVVQQSDQEYVLLLPVDPDASSNRLREKINKRLGVKVGIIINDSIGRAWRVGTTGHAIGVAGLPAVIDLRGEKDMFGKELLVSEQAVADELASAASLLQGQASEALPIVVVRGFKSNATNQTAKALIRERDMDMFR
ncbi:MAG: coenzyme F420-0:L-glutamate ligase [Rhodospirillaceae bacterium]|nr:coenzyme F420-0:L-glutamate ligase [Rhodospirillaceae bacterium]MDG1274876.1 coenzyme F420-0:L-glutamate ligase [Alphaproteobacteria bacterium]MDG1888277.1 coenzyme F420-0:L-glutamate ligase [Alphaproteobacteria bacterium]|tara:strand:- start:1186 stop:1953 length:768 start_codon:yes stop_codon:yes gene_type:complete